MASRGRPTTDRGATVTRLWELGYSDEEIAEQLGLSEVTVKNIRYHFGLINGRAITKHWLQTSGIGAKWDEACRRIRG